METRRANMATGNLKDSSANISALTTHILRLEPSNAPRGTTGSEDTASTSDVLGSSPLQRKYDKSLERIAVLTKELDAAHTLANIQR